MIFIQKERERERYIRAYEYEFIVVVVFALRHTFPSRERCKVPWIRLIILTLVTGRRIILPSSFTENAIIISGSFIMQPGRVTYSGVAIK